MVLGDFQDRDVLHICLIVGQGLTVFAEGSGGVFCERFFFFLGISLFFLRFFWEATLKYCLPEPLNPRHPANQLSIIPVLNRNCGHAFCQHLEFLIVLK